MMSFSVEGEILRETDAAICLKVNLPGDDRDGEHMWFPLSQTESIHRSKKVKGEDSIVITNWLAKTKELL